MEELRPDDEAVIYGQVADMRKITPRRGLTIVNVLLIDGTGAVTLVYFNQPWKGDAFRKGTYVLAYGRIEYNYGKLQISGAETEFISPDELPSFQKLVPVYPLTEGIRISQMRNMISFALDGITSFSVKPLKLISNLGILISVLSIFGLLYALISHLCGVTVAGWTAIVASIWLLGGLQMLCLGVVGGYIGKIYSEVKQRPRFLIETHLKAEPEEKVLDEH